MAVLATLLSAPFAHLSAERTRILDISTVSRHGTDAELTKLQTLVAAYRAIIVARLRRHSLDTLLAPQDALLAGLDTLEIAFF
jgi:phosphoribosyl-dephospho-CoA transferase